MQTTNELGLEFAASHKERQHKLIALQAAAIGFSAATAIFITLGLLSL